MQRANFREDELENYILILTELISNHLKGNNGKELIKGIFDNHNLEIIFALFDAKDDEIIKNISILLHSILAFKLNELNSFPLGMSGYTETEKLEMQPNDNLLFLFEKNLSSLSEIVFEPNEQVVKGVKNDKIFGLRRLKLLECFHLFMSMNIEECINALRFYKFFEKILVK